MEKNILVDRERTEWVAVAGSTIFREAKNYILETPQRSTIRIRILLIQSDWNMQVVVMMNLKSSVFWHFYHSRAEPPISFPVFGVMFEFLFEKSKISLVIFCFTHQGIPMWFRPVIKGSNSVFYFKNINKPENAKTDSIKRKIIIENVILYWAIRWTKASNKRRARSYEVQM